MSEELWTEAWLEARASNRRNTVELATLEFLHPGIIDELGAMVPVRAVAARKPFMLRLEADAPVNGGDLVEFKPLGFKAALPSRGPSQAPTTRVSIDNIGAKLWPYVEKAVEMQADATLILRQYLRGSPDVVVFGPVFFVVTGVTIANGTVEGECSLDQFSDAMVPGLKYTADKFRNLNAS